MKRKINIDRKPLASEEINATKDFGSLVDKVAAAGSVSPKSSASNTGWFVGGIAAVAIATGIYFGTQNNTPITNEEPQIVQTVDPDTTTQKAFVAPPLPEADIQNESYYVNSDKGGKIKHHTGTEITIPKGAFMDEEGNIVEGEVEVQYREFHDQADIFLSGIPMEYDSAGKKQIFESAGMMEIRAFKDGKRLKIVPEKNFVICMHSKNPDPKFNLYYLDEEKRKWEYEGKDSISVPEQIEKANDTVNMFGEFERSYKSKEETVAVQKDIEETEVVVKEIKKEIKTIKKSEPKTPVKANPKKKNFTIDVVKTEYPELATYEGTIFEVVKNEDLPEDTYTVTWNGVELKEKSNAYVIELSKGERTEEIAVIPVLDGDDYIAAKKKFDSKFTEYSSSLKEKKKEEKKAVEKLNKLKEKYRKEREAYEKRLIAMKEKMEIGQQSQLELQRVFNINRFGTWNCDSPIPYPKEMLVKASYQDAETGENLVFTRLDLIEENRNACFPIYAAQLYRLPFNPKRENILWGVTTAGMIAVATNTEFDKVERKNQSFTFKMKVIDIKGKSTAEIKKLLLN